MIVAWLDIAALVLRHLEWAILVYFVLVNSFYAVLLLSAVWEMVQHVRQVWGESHWLLLGSRVAPSISILAPAYNEAAVIGESVHALLALYYPNLEAVVVNDGSSDATLAVLQEQFELVPMHPIYRQRLVTKPIRGLYCSHRHPNLLVVDKDNGGKADTLNVGLQLATRDLVCAMDADTLIEPDALLRMVHPFLLGDDVLAAGGTVRVVNGSRVQGGRVVIPRVPRQALAGCQVVEYLRAFLFGRLGWNRLGGNLIISGAFGLFRREAVIAAGGYTHDTVGEDMELVLRLRRQGYEARGPHQVVFIPDPVAWTEVPESLRVLGRQRDRWHRGLADALWRHRRIFLNPRYGAMGLVTYPYFVFVELLAPMVESLGLVGLVAGLVLGALNMHFAILFFLAAYGYGLVLTTLTLVLEELSFHRYEGMTDRLLLLLWTVLENVGYRQLTVFWRLRGLGKFWRGRTDWGAMEHHGFMKPQGFQQAECSVQQAEGKSILPSLSVCVCLVGLYLGAALVSAEEITLQQPVRPEVQEIEIVYVDNRPPTVSLKAATQSPTPTPVQPPRALEPTARPRQTVPGCGFWVWEYRQVLANTAAILDASQRHGCRRLLVQMPALEDTAELWTAYAQFLSAGHGRGLEIFALDGYPEAIHAPEPLLAKTRRLLTLMADQRLAGLQLDIEPYLLEDFFVDDTGFVRYLAVIEQVREVLAGRTRLSVVMPFWFTSQMLHGRPVAFAVMDRADEVAVMSYRTDVDELRAIVEDTLRYGDSAGVPVWLAIETVALPLERHIVLKRESRRDLADAYLDQTGQRLVLEPPPPHDGLTWFRVHHRTTVRPERLTFAGRTRQEVRTAVATLMSTVAHPSLAGVLIHDLHSFMALPE